MFEQDAPRFTELLVGIGETYGVSLTPVMIDIYWHVLRSYRFEDIKKATFLHLGNPDTGKYLPKPADIIMEIEGGSQRSLLAWTKVLTASQKFGIYSSVAFDDALIHAVIEDMGGWRMICRIDINQLVFVGKEFQNRYKAYVIKKPPRHPKYFVGILDGQSSSSSGDVHKQLTLIGDRTKAMQVVATGSRALVFDNKLLLKNTDGTESKN